MPRSSVRNASILRVPALVAAGILATAAGSAAAHDTWLLAQPSYDGKPHVVLTMTSGMKFPETESPIKPERIARTHWHQGPRSGALTVGRPDDKALKLSTDVDAAGTAVLSVELAPKVLELDAAQVAEYLPELGDDPAIRAAYEKAGTWRERYRKNTKAYFRVGTARDDASATKPAGLPLELVPRRDPTSLGPGGTLVVCLKQNGAAIPGHRIGIVHSTRLEEWADGDAEGCAGFVLRGPGYTMVRAIAIKPAQSPELDWESEFTTLTFSANATCDDP